jgi:AcrR family transcriptional regulator
MSSNSKIKERIISITRKKFYAFGFKKTTMNEIASDSGISKTTLYEYFDSKEKLVEEISQIAINEMKKLIEDLHQELTDGKSFDLIAALKKVIHFAGNKFAGANPAFEEDIRKSAPNIFLEIQNLDDKLREVVRLILKYGVDNGLIRKDISLRVAVELIMNISINLLVNSNNGYHAFFSESEIYDTTTKIILNGLLTDKGKSIMNSMDNNSIKGTNTITTDPHHFDDK